MIKLEHADLNYLLQQANILNDYSRLTSPLSPNGVREVSGHNNNLVGGFTLNADGTVTFDETMVVHADWGQADTAFLRLFATNHPDKPEYGTTYATVQKMWITLNLADPSGLVPGEAGYVPTTKMVLVDNPMAMAPSMFVADANGVAPGGDGYIPTVDAQSMQQAMGNAPAEYQFAPEGATGDILNASVVVDSTPRMISELITSSNVDVNDPNHNPAAVAAMNNLGGHAVGVSNSVVGDISTGFMPNPGILGGVTYNEWFVAFGQFFDHGLDFIQKTGGVVMIPLSPSDPLWVDPSSPAYIPGASNVMMLSRAKLSNPDSDFDGNGNLLPGVVPLYNNNTGLMIDQSQTYGSHETINALVRQYDATGTVTGQLITDAEDGVGSAHDLASWADMKLNALRIGVELIDTDVLDAPWIKADAIGRLMYTAQQDYSFRSDQSIADIEAEAATNGITINGTTYTSYADIAAAGYDPFLRWTVEDSMNGLVDASQIGDVRMTNQAILLDIAHGAAPGFDFQGNELDPESDPNAGAFTYDDALLARHKVSGDGRVNENITLTSVHHVFHEEHNIQANAIKLAAIRDAVTGNTLDMLNGTSAEMDGWLAVDIDQATLDGWAGLDLADDAAVQAVADTLSWDGEKLYQAARVITESEYNHIAVDQYVSGLYPALPEFVSYSTDINLDISLEFAQAIFRLGHSQLRETVQIAVTDGNGIEPGQPGYTPTYTEQGLFDVFLNPDAYDMYGPAGITAGLLTQQGNEMDEFVTAALQQSLVGVPLDLPALNIARGRDVGLPSLNELRQEVFDGLLQNTSNNANGAGIAPYHSWADFGAHLRTPESLANFIAAYGRDTDGTFGLQAARDAYQAGTGTLADMRTAAQRIVDAAADVNDPDHAAALKFMQGTATGEPVYTPPVGMPGDAGYVPGHWDVNSSSGDQGFWDIDLWVGGLAEQPLFDGPLGTTFSFIILDFAQRLQDGDRFYYLYRMPVGQHLGDQIIGEQFADLVMRTTGLEHIPDAFGMPSAVYILDGTDAAGNYQDNARDGIGANDAYGDNDYFNATLEALPDTVTDVAVLNASFEDQSLASDGTGPVYENAVKGNYTYDSPQDWALTGTGGLFAPTEAVIAAAGHAGGNVAWLNPGATLTQATGVTLVAGNSYDLSVNIGDRIDQAGSPSGEVQLIDQNGNVLASAPIATTDGQWSALTLSLTATAAMDGLELSVRIVNSGSGAGQVLVDNVGLTMTEPGGSANDGHIVVIGLSGDDFIVGALGDDVIYGDAGNDVLEGAQGNDHLYGGDGDDYITDYENDDFISGGNGNDTIFAGPGVLDTAHGNDGDDEVHGGDGIDEVFGDNGNDRLYGEGDTDLMIGGDGNDYMEGGDGVDEMFGGNGSDWMRGGVGDDNINGGSGNDLMEGGLGATANDGDRLNGDSVPGTLPVIEYNGDGTVGDMDIASYEHVDISVMASLQTSNNAGTSSNLLDSYALVDGLSGSAQNDILEGGEADAIALNGANNYLVGGGGNDRLTGLGDDGDETTGQADFIFGDSVIVDANLYWIGDPRHDPSVTVTGLIENWYGTGDTRVQFSDGSLGHILGEVGTAGTTDTAVYRGNRADYTVEEITINGQQAVKVTHSNPADDGNGGVLFDDGVDILVGIEQVEFADETVNLILGTPQNDTGVSGRVDGTAGADIMFGLAGNDLLRGLGGADLIAGGTGNDTINAGGGDDTIVWNVGDGTDRVNGQAGSADTFIVNEGGGGSYGIYAVSGAANSGVRSLLQSGFGVTLAAATEIAVLRDGVLIAELRNIEELIVDGTDVSANDGNGIPNFGVTVSVTGDFDQTSLNYSTITVLGGDGDDSVDISGLTSEHRIVFNGGGGHNILSGGNRPQDVLENAQYSEMDQGSSQGQGTSGGQGSTGGQGASGMPDMSGGDDDDSAAPTPTPEMPAAAGGQVVEGTDMAETLLGTGGADLIFAGAGADNVVAQGGDDLIFGDGGADRIFAGEGNDVIEAGAGNDQVFADQGDDLVIAGTNDGSDSYWGGEGSDTLDYAAISTDMEIDLGSGLMGHGQVTTDGVTDQIYGFENIIAGSGNDRIVANAAANSMDGGAGQDTFVFNSAGDADGDVIAGFTPGDKIDLSGIDADQGTAGNQSFVLFASGGFTAAGQLSVSFETRADGDHTLVMGNVDDDMAADFEIDLLGRHELTSADFDGLN